MHLMPTVPSKARGFHNEHREKFVTKLICTMHWENESSIVMMLFMILLDLLPFKQGFCYHDP